MSPILVFIHILPLFIIIGAGWLITKLKIANENWLKPIGDFALFVGFPALIFWNLVKIPIPDGMFSKALLVNSGLVLGMLGLVILSFLIFKPSGKDKATYVISYLFGNTAFLGIPVIASLDANLGQEAAINTAVHLFWVFSLGLILVEVYLNKGSKVTTIFINLLKNPLLIAVLLGFIVNLFEVKKSPVLLEPIEMLGKAVSPMVMLMIGIFMAIHPIKSFKGLKSPFIYSITKLIGFPLLFIWIMGNISSVNYAYTEIIDIAMPIAITPFAMADRFGLNKNFICNSIVISTVLSIITLPFIISLLG